MKTYDVTLTIRVRVRDLDGRTNHPERPGHGVAKGLLTRATEAVNDGLIVAAVTGEYTLDGAA